MKRLAIREAFRALTGRSPDTTEAKILAPDFSRSKRAEFAKNPDGATKLLARRRIEAGRESCHRADFAAMTALVNAIMNFDEFVVQR